MRRSFYEVDKSAYLFSKDDTPEEKVRQWVLFELLSTYGIHINNIKIEEKAKIGSKWYRADIVVQKNQSPYIVIECKRQDDENIDNALVQVISYANYLKAKFVVCTNGNVWRVKREFRGEWLNFPDIEKRIDEIEVESIEKLIWNIDGLKPLLYWLHRPVPPNDAQQFLKFLQQLFHLRSDLFETIDKELLSGTELLLRAMSYDPFDSKKENIPYISEKLYNSFTSYQIYFDSKGFGKLSLGKPEIYDIDEIIRLFSYKFSDIPLENNNHSFEEVSFIRLILSLLRYFQQIRVKQSYLEISEGIMSEFYFFIEPSCRAKLNVRLPDRLEYLEDLRDSCKDKWVIQTS